MKGGSRKEPCVKSFTDEVNMMLATIVSEAGKLPAEFTVESASSLQEGPKHGTFVTKNWEITCIRLAVQELLTGGSPKEFECNIKLRTLQHVAACTKCIFIVGHQLTEEATGNAAAQLDNLLSRCNFDPESLGELKIIEKRVN